MNIVFIGLGTNIGKRRENLLKSIYYLKKTSIKILKISNIYETKPLGGPKQRNYFNAVVKAKTALLPRNLLKSLQSIEKIIGRTKSVRNGPRIIDLDILLYNSKKIKSSNLTIPHSRIKERLFVLLPLYSIEPNLYKLLGFNKLLFRHASY